MGQRQAGNASAGIVSSVSFCCFLAPHTPFTVGGVIDTPKNIRQITWSVHDSFCCVMGNAKRLRHVSPAAGTARGGDFGFGTNIHP